MSKVQIFQVNKDTYFDNLDELFLFLSKNDNPKTIRKYMESLLTESELIMISRRIETANLLLEGYSYEEIARQMKVGVDTVAKVKNNLKKFLSNQEKFQKMTKSKTSAPYLSFDHLRKKYKGYFALINAFMKD